MKRLGPQFCLFLLVLAAAITLACGSSHGDLQSISVSPAAANAQGYSNGQVQLTAVGYYSGCSSPSPVQVNWSTCNQPDAPSSEITVSTQGVGHCKPGASGTYIVSAANPNPPSPVTCNVLLACGEAGHDCFNTYGVAKLTCP